MYLAFLHFCDLRILFPPLIYALLFTLLLQACGCRYLLPNFLKYPLSLATQAIVCALNFKNEILNLKTYYSFAAIRITHLMTNVSFVANFIS